jgi:hypothetical protein
VHPSPPLPKRKGGPPARRIQVCTGCSYCGAATLVCITLSRDAPLNRRGPTKMTLCSTNAVQEEVLTFISHPSASIHHVADAQHASDPLRESVHTARWNTEPGLREMLALMTVMAALFIVTVLHFGSYVSLVHNSGDNGAYISAASAIRHWDFRDVKVKQFWGYSYVVAAASLTGIPMNACLLLVSILCSVLSVVICFRIWGGRIAALFAISNFDWMQRSLLGGSEPLFVLLLFASFWAARVQRWRTAALLASFATITRPVGVIALLAIGIVLLWQRDFRRVLPCTCIAVGIGMLYVLPFHLYFGDPFYQVKRYQNSDWHAGSAVNWPLHAIVQSLVHNREPWTNVALTTSWIVFAIVGLSMLVLKKSSLAAAHAKVEWLFAVMYTTFLLCYSSPEWARAEFSRFLIPALPMLFGALSGWLPRDRKILWVMAIVSPLLAAASALGIRNVLAALRAP